ncbi:hypothetical protein [Burkholderia cenocepacia]|jgi:hypothetical protein|uniref:hypothetical protein n=1 Tax=Burkholderia cenocepacia TaxID=95486 RepID=UPI0024B85D15|nr:hypothetical protein [Burkholderia cenocepacia]MDI9688515.1 hypothetical protein [Burkholderia cenocepacia]
MSYRLEYQWAAFLVPGAPIGLSEDRFVIAVEGGDNNVRNARTGRRARSWDACMVGTRNQVLQQAVHLAGACEGGSLQPRGRYCTPENYIRRIRRLVDRAKNEPPHGYWHLRLRVAQDHAVVAEVRQLGIEVRIESWYGTPRAIVDVPSEHLAAYFGLIDRYAGELPAWCWVEVGGLPAS